VTGAAQRVYIRAIDINTEISIAMRAWPPSVGPDETLMMTSAQFALLIDGVDWRAPEQRWRPAVAG